MVYKRYFKRGSKRYGPYYYTTIRTPDGKVKSIYIGRYPPKAPPSISPRVNYIPPKQDQTPILSKEFAFHLSLAVIFLLITALFLVKYPTITGFLVGVTETYTKEFNLTINESHELDLVLDEPVTNFTLKSLKVSGTLIGDGRARIYLVAENSSYLIFDSEEKEKIAPITGFFIAAKERFERPPEEELVDEEIVEEESEEEDVGEEEVEPEEEVEEEVADEEVEEIELEEEVEPEEEIVEEEIEEANITEPEVEEIEEVNITENVTEKIEEINITIENVTVEKNVTENVTIKEENITWANVTEVNVTVTKRTFSDACIETCVLPELNLTKYKLKIELEGDVVLILDSVEYEVRLEIEEIELGALVLDAENRTVALDAQIEDQRGNVVKRVSVTLQPRDLPGKGLAPTPEKVKLNKGTYNIQIKPKDHVIQELLIEDAKLIKPTPAIVRLDTPPPEEKDFVRVYAIDPKINFTKATVKVMAVGDALYKCENWNFDARRCEDPCSREKCSIPKWRKIKDLVPGQFYTIELTPEDPAYAEYNASYSAPVCKTSQSPCVANSSLLRSRDNLEPREPNYPNTIDTCRDGTSGDYQDDESVENITITDLNSSSFRGGDTIRVDAWVYCYDSSSDNINFVYTNNTQNPSWRVVSSIDPCPSAGFYKASKTFVLDDVEGYHAVRVIIQYNGQTSVTCGTGSYDDNDDVVFFVASNATAQQPGNIFFDGFESGDFSKGWTTSGGSTSNWVVSSTNPYQGQYHARASNTDGNSILRVYISTEGFVNITLSYYRRLGGIDDTDEFAAGWNNGTTNFVLERTGSGSANDADYLFRSFNLGSTANNNPNLSIGFLCNVNSGTEFCHVDNVALSGTDVQAPRWSNQSQNNSAPLQGESVLLSAYWTDNAKLKQAILSTNESGSWENKTTLDLSGKSAWSNFTWQNSSIPGGTTIGWRIWAKDTSGNWNVTSIMNFTVQTIDNPPTTNLVSPSNGSTITASNTVNFTCNATDDIQLANITFYWNYTGTWQANGTVSVSGTSNQTTFVRTDLNNGVIKWNCLACDNASQCDWGDANWTVTINYVNNAPQIQLHQPANNTQFNDTQDVKFNFTATDDHNVTLSCSLYLDGVLNQTNNSVQNGTVTEFFVQGLAYGNHSWYVNCTDGELANSSEVRVFNIADTIPPSIYYNPNTDTSGLTNKNWIFVNVTATDANLDTVLLEWNNVNETFDNNLGDVYWENKTNLNDGTYIFRAHANDTFGNSNFTSLRNITIDTTSPVVYYNPSTTQEGTLSQNWIFINITCSDPHKDSVKLYWNGVPENFDNSSGDVYWENKTGLSNGNYSFYAWCNDSVGNTNQTSTRTVTLDTVAPQVNFVLPTPANNTIQSKNWVFVNATVTDTLSDIDSCLLEWNGVNESMTKVGTGSNVYCYINKTSLADGTYSYKVYANDSAGNWNVSETRIVTVDLTAPTINFVPPTPSNASVISQTWVYINTTASESLSVALLEWGGANETMQGSGTNWYLNKTGLSSGTYTFKVYGNDSANNWGVSETRSVKINFPPQITIHYPANNTQFNDTQTITFNFTATDDLSATLTCSIYLDGVLNQTNNSVQNNTVTEFTIAGISYGSHSWYINCTDGELSNTSETRTFTIADTLAPNIYYNANTDNNGTYSKNWIFINITCSDIHKDTVTLNWNGTNESFDNSNGDLYWENKTNLADGIYTFYAWCNDSYGNWNQTGARQITLDATPPTYSNDVDDSGGSVTEGAIVNISTLWSDNIQLDTAIFRTNKTGSWKNESTCALSGTSAWCNKTINTTGLAGKTICWNQYANDSAGNWNNSMSLHCFFVTPLDAPPSWSNNQTSIVTTYSPTTQSQFNITWTDDHGISAVLFESNYSGSAQNYSMGLVSGDATNGTYTYSAILPAGTHYWKSHANDTANQWNTTDTWIFVVNKATPTLTLTASPSWNEVYGTQTTVSCNASTPEVTPKLYRNGVLVSNPDVQILAAGTYNYTCNASATQNYTSASTSNILTINKAADTVKLYLNGAEANLTITYGTQSNATATSTSGTEQLYRDGNLVSNPEITILAAGVYQYKANSTGNQNYTAGADVVYYLTVNKATSTCSLTFTPSSPQTYGTAINASCSCTNPEANATLWRNGIDVTASENNQLVILPAGNHSYVCNVSQTQNYTAASNSSNYTINKAPTTTYLYLNGNRANLTVTYGTQTNVTATTSNGSVYLYRNGIAVTNPDIQTLAAGIYNYTAVNPGNANYTSSSETWWLTVNQQTPSCNLSFTPASPQTYGTQVNASCSCTNPEASARLYRDGVDVTSSENGLYTMLAAGVHNYTCNVTSTQNYTSASSNATYTINKATGLIYLYLNGSRANFTVYDSGYVNISAILVNGTGNIQVYNNGTLIYNGSSPSENITLFDSVGLYNITALYSGNQNYTSDSETWWVNVTSPPEGGPGAGGAARGAAAAGAVVEEEEVEEISKPKKVYYIGDFARASTFTQTIQPNQRWIFTYKAINHSIEVIEISGTFVKFRLLSEPVYITLEIGQTKEIDIDEDNIPDIKLTLNSIEGKQISITLELIVHFEIQKVEKAVEETGPHNFLVAIFFVLLLLFIYKKRKRPVKKRKKRKKKH